MSNSSELEKITELADTVVSGLGIALVGARFGQTGRRRSLELTIYRPGRRISMDDCEKVSRTLEAALDEQTPPLISGSFLLEVQSPGIDRQLETERELQLFSGETVAVTAKDNLGILGLCFLGTLVGCSQGRVTIGNPRPAPVHRAAKVKGRRQTGEAEIEYPPQLEIEMDKLVRIKLHTEIGAGGQTPETNA